MLFIFMHTIKSLFFYKINYYKGSNSMQVKRKTGDIKYLFDWGKGRGCWAVRQLKMVDFLFFILRFCYRRV